MPNPEVSLMGVNLIPAYGKDYKNEAEVISAWLSEAHFLVSHPMHKWNQTYRNITNMKVGEFVFLHYRKRTQIAIFTKLGIQTYETK